MTPKISNTKRITKRAVELIIALIGYGLYLIVLPAIYLRSRISGKACYVNLDNTHELELRVFNTPYSLLRYLPLSCKVLKGKVAIIGSSLYEKSDFSTMPGLISLYSLRSLSGIDHDSVEETDREYLEEASVVYDLKLGLRFLIASLFSSRRKAYKNRLELLGVRFLNTTMEDTVNFIKHQVKQNKKSLFYFINADTLNKAYKKSAFKRVLNATPYVLPDGIGVKIACNMMEMPLRQNVNGTDLFPFLCTMAEQENYKIFLYGAKEGVADTMKEKVLEQFSNLQIVGTLNGYDHHDNEVVNMINHSEADIVLVAKGAPLQEEWIDTYGSKIAAPVILGVGGLFDFYSGSISRAPIWMREIGLEWVYRLMQEPKRMWKRYVVGNPLFLLRAYLWHREQKNKLLQEYYNTVASRRMIPFADRFSRLVKRFYPIGKRIMDISVTSLAILMLSPLLIATALLIKLESRGPVIFKQKRIGRDGKPFSMLKFRSMVQDAEELKKKLAASNESGDGVIFKMKEDPRITRVGKFIRKWSIDELPQLFNVLRGDMSLVGPRPPVPSEVDEYVIDDLKRLHVVPGITCYWQISGRSEIPFKQQVDLDKKYISTHSLWTDIKILFGTIPAVLSQKGAY